MMVGSIAPAAISHNLVVKKGFLFGKKGTIITEDMVLELTGFLGHTQHIRATASHSSQENCDQKEEAISSVQCYLLFDQCCNTVCIRPREIKRIRLWSRERISHRGRYTFSQRVKRFHAIQSV